MLTSNPDHNTYISVPWYISMYHGITIWYHHCTMVLPQYFIVRWGGPLMSSVVYPTRWAWRWGNLCHSPAHRFGFASFNTWINAVSLYFFSECGFSLTCSMSIFLTLISLCLILIRLSDTLIIFSADITSVHSFWVIQICETGSIHWLESWYWCVMCVISVRVYCVCCSVGE